MKNTGNVPKLRFPEFRDAGAWEKSTLEKIIDLQSGYAFQSEYFLDYGKKLLTPKNFTKMGYARFNEENTKYTVENFDQKYVCKEGELLILLTDLTPSCELLGKPILLTREDGEVLLNQRIAKIILREQIEIVFLFYFFLTESFHKRIKNTATGSTVRHSSSKIILTTDIYLPLESEQQKIAHCLTSLDDLITAEAQKLNSLKAHKKGLMQQLFPAEGETIPKLRFPEFRNAGAWDILPLGKICENLDSQRIPITESDRVKGNIPYYGASGIIDYVKDFIFDEDLLCVSEDGANLVARTYPIAFSISGKTWVNNHAHVLRFPNEFTLKIIENYLNSISLEDFLTGMAQPKLNRAKLDIIPIPLAKTEEQRKIADCLSSLDDLITTQTQKNEALKLHKKGLMQQLFPAVEEVKE